MVKTNAERQAAYRSKAAETGQRRMNLFVSAEAYDRLQALADASEISMRQVIEDMAQRQHFEEFGVKPE